MTADFDPPITEISVDWASMSSFDAVCEEKLKREVLM